MLNKGVFRSLVSNTMELTIIVTQADNEYHGIREIRRSNNRNGNYKRPAKTMCPLSAIYYLRGISFHYFFKFLTISLILLLLFLKCPVLLLCCLLLNPGPVIAISFKFSLLHCLFLIVFSTRFICMFTESVNYKQEKPKKRQKLASKVGFV